MSLESGTKLGPYEIVGPIGAGGMGEVYRARDTRLERTVAIKVLPEHLAENTERRERLEREAKALSQLSHPNICALHDIGHQDGVDFLVMEFLEGQTLAERLKRGTLSREDAIHYGIQIAEGLDRAHRAGIVHRDLKPANVILTKEGVKLLDFGLAKLVDPRGALNDSEAPTVQKDLTSERAVLGTPRYMAPEQLEGDTADARTDIFAFGRVLREMLTGRKAEAQLPEGLHRVVTKCLAIDRDERWQTARDLADELRWLSGASRKSERSARHRLPYLIAAAVGAAVAGVSVWFALPSYTLPPRSPVHFRLELPRENVLPGVSFSPSFAFSRDGTQLVIRAEGPDGVLRLYLRSLSDPQPRVLPGTEGAAVPFFSWDGATVAFYQNGEFHRIPITGGAATRICEAPDLLSGASWGPDDVIVFSAGAAGLMKVAASGGVAETLTSKKSEEIRHRWPQFLPDGRSILFTVETTEGFRPAVASLETGDYSVLEGAGFGRGARYLRSGHLVVVTQEGLHAMPFDLDHLEVRGSPVPVIDDVHVSPVSGLAYFEASDNSLVYLSGAVEEMERSLLLVDRDGTETPLLDERDYFESPRYSPDGTKIAVVNSRRGRSVWIYDLRSGARDLLSSASLNDNSAVWAPDGRCIAFARRYVTLMLKTVGSDGEEELHRSEHAMFPSSWAPDGMTLAFYEFHAETQGDIWMLPIGGQAEPWLVTDASELTPRFSPDGRFVAYASNETGRSEIYVRPYPGPGEKVPVSSGGGSEPIWSPDGRELFYRQRDAVMSAPIETSPSFHAGRPAELFRGPYRSIADTGAVAYDYDVAPDGKHFLMVEKGPERGLAGEIDVIVDWSETLKRLVPAEK